MDRRELLKMIAAATAAEACRMTPQSTMPVIFLAHGAPMVLEDPKWMGEWTRWGRELPRPKSILMVSAHWEARPTTLGATRTVPLVYDFYGFPERFYHQQYAAPGAPELASRVRSLLGETADEPERGLDHGAYVPLVAMYPKADVPVLQMSLPTLEPVELLALGKKLAPLRKEGVLIVGSGFITHNLRAMDWSPDAVTPAWAADFDAWTAEAVTKRDADRLVQYRELAPGVRMSLPTHEHFVPLVVALGAALEHGGDVRYPISGFAFGSGTKRSVQFG
jgi:4,5-DOPA dioxygenase extradiol